MKTIHYKRYNTAIIGATGNAGGEILNILRERNFPINNLYAVASEKSKAQQIKFGNDTITVQTIDEIEHENIDLAFFCAGSDVSSKYATQFTDKNTIVIDKTSQFRFHPQVPLIVTEINSHTLGNGLPIGIVSNPNCVAIPLAMTLSALQSNNKIKRVIVSTYQSVSGAGKKGVQELHEQTIKAINAENIISSGHFRKQIAFNVIPAIGGFKPGGATDEEEKIALEVLKILGKNVKVFVTCVRVPVFLSHSASVVVEMEEDISPYVAADLLSGYQGIVVVDNPDENSFATPIDAQRQDVVFVSRIRRDNTAANSIAYWLTCDNLRKGAALNGVQIAETLINIDSSLATFYKKNK